MCTWYFILQEIARDCLRVDKLMTFGDYLCGIDPPLLYYNVATNRYVSIAPESVQSDEEQKSHDNSMVGLLDMTN